MKSLTDIGRLDLLSNPDVSEPDQRLRARLGPIVESGTVGPSGVEWPTPLSCRRRPERKPCAGRLLVRRQDIPAEIHWRCPACGDRGTIVGWRGTVWDWTPRPHEPDPDDEPAEVVITEPQYWALRESLLLGREAERIVAGARLTVLGVTISASLDDLDDLAGYVAAEANHTKSLRHRDLMNGVLDRINTALEPRHLDEALPPTEMDALDARIAAAFARPDPALGGLSAPAVYRLLTDDWEGPGSVVELDDSLTLTELAGARLLENGRRFLAALVEGEGARATATGNLGRAFVGRMLEDLRWPAGYLERVRRVNKIINEHDVMSIHILRVLLQVSGLIQRRKGVFHATRRGKELWAEEGAGKLYARLFRIHFREFNLAYLDRLPAGSMFQQTIAYSLFRFVRLEARWSRPDEMVEDLVLPAVRAAMPPDGHFNRAAALLEWRLLDPLVDFGLAEKRAVPSEHPFLERRIYRKTPLADRFPRFTFAEDT